MKKQLKLITLKMCGQEGNKITYAIILDSEEQTDAGYMEVWSSEDFDAASMGVVARWLQTDYNCSVRFRLCQRQIPRYVCFAVSEETIVV